LNFQSEMRIQITANVSIIDVAKKHCASITFYIINTLYLLMHLCSGVSLLTMTNIHTLLGNIQNCMVAV